MAFAILERSLARKSCYYYHPPPLQLSAGEEEEEEETEEREVMEGFMKRLSLCESLINIHTQSHTLYRTSTHKIHAHPYTHTQSDVWCLGYS